MMKTAEIGCELSVPCLDIDCCDLFQARFQSSSLSIVKYEEIKIIKAGEQKIGVSGNLGNNKGVQRKQNLRKKKDTSIEVITPFFSPVVIWYALLLFYAYSKQRYDYSDHLPSYYCLLSIF